MTTLVVRCADCQHTANLPADQVSLIRSGDVTTYAFQCPACAGHTIRVPSAGILEELSAVGIHPRTVTVAPRPTGPPLTVADLAAFLRSLDRLPTA